MKINSFAQNNEDIIVDDIMKEYNILRTGYSVEFGGWDGLYLSNIAFFNKKYNDNLLFIEGDISKVNDGIKNYKNVSNVKFENTFVNFSGANSLDKILAKNHFPNSFDILSIDVDGNDYHIWTSLENFSPSIVIIEFNFSIPNDVEFVQEKNMRTNHGSSAKSLCHLATKKGYSLLRVTESNLIFLNNRYITSEFKNDNKLNELRDDSNVKVYLFYGYDGKIFLSKETKMYWQKFIINRTRFQIIPSFLRSYPKNKSFFTNLLHFFNSRIK